MPSAKRKIGSAAVEEMDKSVSSPIVTSLEIHKGTFQRSNTYRHPPPHGPRMGRSNLTQRVYVRQIRDLSPSTPLRKYVSATE